MRDFPLPQAVRKDVKRLAMLCFSLDIYANEDGEEKGGAEEDQEDKGTDEDDAIDQTQQSGEPGEQKPSDQEAEENTLPEENGSHHHHDNNIIYDDEDNHHGSETGTDGAEDNKKSYSNNITDHSKEFSTKSASDVITSDQQRAAFIERHFEFLDSSKLLEMLREKPGRHLKAVSALLDREADADKGSSISKALDVGDAQMTFDLLLRANLSSRNPALSMSHVKSLCALDPGLALDLMVADYPSISPWHVDHILWVQSGQQALVLDYIQSFLTTFPRSEWNGFMKQVHSVGDLLLAIMEAALTFDPPCHEDLFCACGKLPRPGSHMIDWRHNEILDLLLTHPTIPDTVLPLLERAGYWKGVLAVMKKSGSKMATLRLCVQLGDLSLIQDQGRGLLPSSDEEWTTLLQWMASNQPSLNPDGSPKTVRCLNCGASLVPICPSIHSGGTPRETQPQGSPTEDVPEFSPSSQPECDWSVQATSDQSDQSAQGIDLMPNHTDPQQGDSGNILEENPDHSLPDLTNEGSYWLPTITWQRVVFLLVRHIGAKKGVQLLSDVRPPESALTREFHQMCILSSLWEKQQNLLCHAMLEGTATYLWSKGQPLLGPRLQHAVLSELQSIRDGQKGSSSVTERVLSLKRRLSGKQLYIEDPNTHWGTSANLAGQFDLLGYTYQ
ncbi:uncharacterized protein [Diadema setosum]|uniref:uncharacterized protein n=1 Tax=Diadema setosum TaxID=31175 RepID=UPI003B3B038A